MIDELFEDIETLAREHTTADECSGTFVLDSLPPQYAHQYGELFAKRFLVAVVNITGRLTGAGWEPASCVAEELALRILLEGAESTLEIFGLTTEHTEAALSTFFDLALEDADHELLYQPEFDGVDEDPDFAHFRIAPLGFDHWFEPVNDTRFVHPYALNDAPEGESAES